MIKVTQYDPNKLTIRIEGSLSIEQFRELVQRATNLWPDAPPAIKYFADEITNHDILKHFPHRKLQHYESQDTSKAGSLTRVAVTCGSCQSDGLIDVAKNAQWAVWSCSHCMASNRTEF